MKRGVALMTAVLLLVLLLAGCASGPTTTGTTGATTTKGTTGGTTSGTTDDGKPDTFIADRVIQGRIFLENDGDMLPRDQLNTPVALKIKELTGIQINWKSTGANNGLEEMTLALAANDIPEVMVSYLDHSGRKEASVLFKAAREGMFTDLAPYLDDTEVYSLYNDTTFVPPDTYNNITHREEFNGAVYLFHMNIDRPREASQIEFRGSNKPMIRWDILKDLGKTPADIRTWEDFLNLCQAIKDKQYTDANGKEIYVIGPRMWGGDIVSATYKPFDWGNGTRFGVVDGKIKHVTETEWAWKQVSAMRELQAKGFLHPEYFTMDNSRGEEGVINGSWAINPQGSYMENNGDMAYVPLAYLQNYLGESDVYYGTERGGYCVWAVMSDAEKPEEILKFADFLASRDGKMIWQYGIEGETYDLVNGQPRIKKEIFDENATDRMAFKDKWGFNPGGGFQWWLLGSTNNFPMEDFGEEGVGIEFDTAYQNRMKIFDYCGDVPMKPMLEAPNALAFLGDPAMASVTPNLDPVLIAEEWSKTFVQAVIAKSDADAQAILDNYRERLIEAGLEDFRKFLQDKYDADPNSIRFYNNDNY